MRVIYTNKDVGYEVDNEDYEYLNQFNWYTTSRGHAQGCIDGEIVYMHRVIFGDPSAEVVDHIDRNPYNNRRENLRRATFVQNSVNSKKQSGTSSVYKGVSWHTKSNKWTMKYYEDGKQIHGGYFDDEWEAAEAYNKEMLRLHGEFANLNQEGNEHGTA